MQYTAQMQPDPVEQPPMVAPDNVQIDGNGRAVVIPKPDPGQEAPQPQGEQRPAWLPEKFKSPEELAKSYSELEKAFHAKNSPKQETPATPATTPESAPSGIDMAALSQEFSANGSLSDETYTTLASKGFDRAAVDSIIEGQKAIAAQLRTQIAAVAGGEEKLEAVLSWAKDNLPAAQIDAYETAAATKNVELVKLALSGIAAAHAKANPAEPSRVTGQPAPGTTGVQPFRSNAEMIAAINNPSYAKDPAYRADVQARIAATN